MNNINESTYSRPSSPSSISDSSRMSPTHPHDKHHHKTYTNKNEDTKSKPLPKLNQWLGSAFKNRDGRPSDIQHLLSHSSAVPLPSTMYNLLLLNAHDKKEATAKPTTTPCLNERSETGILMPSKEYLKIIIKIIFLY